MSNLWRNGATLIEKISGVFLIILIISSSQVIYTHNFMPSESGTNFAIWSSLAFTIFYCSLMLYARKTSRVKVEFPYSGFKKTIVILLMPFFIYGMSWLCFAISTPQVYTLIAGEERSELESVIKEDFGSSRRGGCAYRIIPKQATALLVHYCIPSSLFHSLPDKEFEVQFLTKNSLFGTHYRKIVAIPSGR